MDVDWCLTCEKRLEAPSLYCSQDCRYLAASTSSTLLDQDEDDEFHTVDDILPLLSETTSGWTGNDSAGISAWAAKVPYGAPAEQPRISLRSHSVRRPPQLLSLNSRIVPPSLCKNPPQVIPPLSSPLPTPKPSHSTIQALDISRISLKSAFTESSLATPVSSHPVPISTTQQPLGMSSIYSQVRSWATPSPSLVQFERATLPTKLKSFKLTPSVRPHPVKVVSSSNTPQGFLDDNSVHWKAGAILLEQSRIKRAPEHQQLRGHRLLHEFPRLADKDSSFRARGRKAARAVA
jgi:hypothetical protein